MSIKASIKGIDLEFETSPRLFSPRQIDAGTLAMLSFVGFSNGQKVLDLGCGYGIVGILAARFTEPTNVYMLDVDEEAVAYAAKNAELNGVGGVHVFRSDGLDALDEAGFDLILSNPPYHTDFSVAKRFIEKSFNRLKLGGRLLMVTKRRDWYRNKLVSVFGGVKVHESGGYFVFEAERRSPEFGGNKSGNKAAETIKDKRRNTYGA